MKNCIIVTLIITLTLLAGLVVAEPIAQVGEYAIDSALLYERMNSYKDAPSLEEAHQRAMQELIEEQLLLIYAQEQSIVIEDDEVDAFFIDVFNTHPRFMTNGAYDHTKFIAAKTSPEIQKILTGMRRELLINKTRTILTNSFDIDDSNLLELFILDNAEIDIHYTIMNTDDLNTDTLVEHTELEAWYRAHRYEYQSPEKVRIELLLVPYAAFSDSAFARTELLLKEQLATSTDSLSAQQIDALGNSIYQRELKALTQTAAQDVYFTQNREASFATITTPLLAADDRCGSVPAEVIQQAIVTKSNRYSQPVLRPDGYLLYRVVQHLPSHPLSLDAARFTVWKDFLEQQHRAKDEHLYQKYFVDHLDDFIVPAASIHLYTIKETGLLNLSGRLSRNEITRTLRDILPDEQKAEAFLKEQGIEYDRRILFLQKFLPPEQHVRTIIRRVNSLHSSGIVSTDSADYFFVVQSQLSNYLPGFREVEPYMPRLVPIVQADTTGYKAYFEEHSPDFATPDSVKIGGVFYPIVADTVTIDHQSIEAYYHEHRNTMYREASVSFTPVFTRSKACAEHIASLPVNEAQITLIPAFFDEGSLWKKDQIYALENLPPALKEACRQTVDGNTVPPVSYQDGWIVCLQLQHHQGGFLSTDDAYAMIRRRLQRQIAEQQAKLAARSVFDSTRKYYQTAIYADSAHMFVTPFQDADGDFGPLGTIDDIRQELFRIWHNDKYSAVVERPDGYAVVFMLKRRSSRQLSYEQSIPEIERKFAEQERIQRAKNMAFMLRDAISAGAPADSVLYYIAPWQQQHNLKLGSEIPGLEYSRLILEDIIKRSEGYTSPVLPLPGNRFFFYHIDRIRKVEASEFEANKEHYRQQLIQQQYQAWLERYKSKFQIITG